MWCGVVWYGVVWCNAIKTDDVVGYYSLIYLHIVMYEVDVNPFIYWPYE